MRKGGLEPPRFYPPDPKFAAHEKSTTCTDWTAGTPSSTDRVITRVSTAPLLVYTTPSGLCLGTNLGTADLVPPTPTVLKKIDVCPERGGHVVLVKPSRVLRLEKDLKEIRHNLAHLSLPAVREFYERAYQDCRLDLQSRPDSEADADACSGLETVVEVAMSRGSDRRG